MNQAYIIVLYFINLTDTMIIESANGKGALLKILEGIKKIKTAVSIMSQVIVG